MLATISDCKDQTARRGTQPARVTSGRNSSEALGERAFPTTSLRVARRGTVQVSNENPPGGHYDGSGSSPRGVRTSANCGSIVRISQAKRPSVHLHVRAGEPH